MTALDIPKEPPSMVKIPAAARALGLPERHIRSMVEAERLAYRQPGGRSGHRYILTADLKRYADALGIALNWDALADAV